MTIISNENRLSKKSSILLPLVVGVAQMIMVKKIFLLSIQNNKTAGFVA
ncbi:MAG: hypothetical protein M5E90_05050 [Asgard group archaeon]|nr:hypothetical protein [Asgard group archaeon]